MVFSSLTFLFLFLPPVLALCLVLTWWSNRHGKGAPRAANLMLLLSSLLFYFWGEQELVLVMMASTLVDYACGAFIGRHRNRRAGLGRPTGWERAGLGVSIVTNLTFLGIFKYFNFGVDNLQALFAAFNVESESLSNAIYITLPIGISFYTFQSMSYTIDVYRGDVRPAQNLIDFAAFVTMFPQLVAGPIVRYRDVAEQLVERRVGVSLFASGVRRFAVGLAKKVLIANTVALPADRIFALSSNTVSGPVAWLGLICYALQIYYDFSGYSDMAIGLGRMLGFTFPENFRWPYSARSIQEFWRRWHISLSTWFRDYLYIPLGGSRGGPLRTYGNLCLVFLLCGLWHGASWTFVIWGGYHGLFLVLERLGLKTFIEHRLRPLQHVYVMLVVLGGWLLFRSENFAQVQWMAKAMLGHADAGSISFPVSYFLDRDVWAALILGSLFSLPLGPYMAQQWSRLYRNATATVGVALVETLLLFALLILCVLLLAGGAHNPFIYFRF